MENENRDDWREELHLKIRSIKEMCLPHLSDLYQATVDKLQHEESLPQQQRSDQFEKLKQLKTTLEQMIKFLCVPKSRIIRALKHKIDHYEKQIMDLLKMHGPRQLPQSQTILGMQQNASSSTPGSSLEPGQGSGLNNGNGGDWQEQVFQKIQSMKEMYLPQLNEMYQRVAIEVNQQDSVPQQQRSDKLEKLIQFKTMLERMMQFLSVQKTNILPALKDKVAYYEKQIIGVLSMLRPRDTVQQPQQLSQSQTIQDQSRGNQTNPQMQSMSMQVSGPRAQESSLPYMQNNVLSSLPRVSAPQQQIPSFIPASSLESGQGNALNYGQQVLAMGSMLQNTPQVNNGSASAQSGLWTLHSNVNQTQLSPILLQHQQLKDQLMQLKQQIQYPQMQQQQQMPQEMTQQLKQQIQYHQMQQQQQQKMPQEMTQQLKQQLQYLQIQQQQMPQEMAQQLKQQLQYRQMQQQQMPQERTQQLRQQFQYRQMQQPDLLQQLLQQLPQERQQEQQMRQQSEQQPQLLQQHLQERQQDQQMRQQPEQQPQLLQQHLQEGQQDQQMRQQPEQQPQLLQQRLQDGQQDQQMRQQPEQQPDLLQQLLQYHLQKRQQDQQMRQQPEQQPQLLQQHLQERQQDQQLRQQPEQQFQLHQMQQQQQNMSSSIPSSNLESGQGNALNNTNGGDWQEEVFQKINSMKEKYLTDLNELYAKVVARVQQDSLPPQERSQYFERQKQLKTVLEHIIQFISVSKSNILPASKEKVDYVEMEILHYLNNDSFRRVRQIQDQSHEK